MGRIADRSPRTLARSAGVFQALEGVTATFGQVYVLGQIVVRGNPAATASRMLEHETLYRLGFASALLAVAFHVAWGVLRYRLFAPVDRNVSLLSLAVLVVGCTMQAVAALLTATAAAACWIPSRRAARVHPTQALHSA